MLAIQFIYMQQQLYLHSKDFFCHSNSIMLEEFSIWGEPCFTISYSMEISPTTYLWDEAFVVMMIFMWQ